MRCISHRSIGAIKLTITYTSTLGFGDMGNVLTPVALAACEVGDVITVGELGPLSFDAAVLDICFGEKTKQNKKSNH